MFLLKKGNDENFAKGFIIYHSNAYYTFTQAKATLELKVIV